LAKKGGGLGHVVALMGDKETRRSLEGEEVGKSAENFLRSFGKKTHRLCGLRRVGRKMWGRVWPIERIVA